MNYDDPYPDDDPKSARYLDYMEDRAEQLKEGC